MSENVKNKKEQKDNTTDKFPKRPKLPKKPKGTGFNYYWIYLLALFSIVGIFFLQVNNTAENVSWVEFEYEILKKHHVKELVVSNSEDHVEVYIKKDSLNSHFHQQKGVIENKLGGGTNAGPHYFIKILTVDDFSEDLKRAQKDFEPHEKIYPKKEPKNHLADILFTWILPIGILIGLWIFLMRRMAGGGPGGQLFNIGKSKATLFDKNSQVSVTFKDVAGLDEAKIEVKEIVDFLKNPKKYTDLGGKIPRGALLVGPPGTGKTLLAKAVAGEAGVPFFSLSGSDFVEMFVGVGASRVRDLFKQAKEKSPCIVFIDEIDAIGRARGKSLTQGANDERENTLNQLLTEMDGFGSNTGVIILAATNRVDVLDRALLRAGRFDRQIYVDLPDLREREEIFKVHVKPIKVAEDVDVQFLAKQTPGFSGADIANICNESALIAARQDKKLVGRQDFLDAVDRIIGGLEKKNKIISPGEKKVIAYHEAGHAAVSWLLEHAHPLVKVTIVPRGKSLGAAWYLPEERQITTAEQLIDEICAALGGRAAEEIVFGKISTGALSDLEKITKQAYAMVTVYGLNSKLGNISYYDSTGNQDYSFTKPYSEKTAQMIDEEVRNLIENCYNRTKQLLIDNKEKLSKLANVLLEKEVIFKEDLETIFGKRPFNEAEPIDGSDQLLADVNLKKKKTGESQDEVESAEKDNLSPSGEDKTEVSSLEKKVTNEKDIPVDTSKEKE